jgi:2-dehydropantoate 2-reductase
LVLSRQKAITLLRSVLVAPITSVTRTMAAVDRLPADSTASMQRDIAAGRPSELEYQNGAVVRLGKESGVETPVNEWLYTTLTSPSQPGGPPPR